MNVPQAPHPGWGRHHTEVSVKLLCLDCFLHETFFQNDHLFALGVCREPHGRIDQFPQPSIAAVSGPGSKGGEKILLDIEDEQVVVDGHVDATADFATDFDLAQVERC